VLEAARRLESPGAELHYLIVGQRHSGKAEAIEYERQLRQRAQQPPLAGRVHFLGRREDVAAILNEITLLVHAARQEPFGRVLLEAAASGVPVVAADVGGTREVFGAAADPSVAAQHGCLIVPSDDAAAVAEAMRRVVAAPDLAQRLARAGRRWAVDRLDVRQAVAQLLRHYRDLHEQRRPVP
jgi:glycosyltransferase involved in cell wall biosynthesis